MAEGPGDYARMPEKEAVNEHPENREANRYQGLEDEKMFAVKASDCDLGAKVLALLWEDCDHRT